MQRSSRGWCRLATLVLFLLALSPALAMNPARVRGKVVDATDAPVAGADLVFEPLGAGRPMRTVTSKKSGALSVPFIEFGKYQLKVEAEGREVASFFIDEKGGARKTFFPIEGELGPGQALPEIDLQPSHEYIMNFVLRSADETAALRLELARAEEADAVRTAGEHFTGGRLEEAVAEVDRVLEGDPDNAMAHYLKGMALLQLDRGPEAAAPLRRAAELAPEQPGVHFGLGTVLLEEADDLEEMAKDAQARAKRLQAAEEFERELELSPGSPEVTTNLALAHYKAGDYAAAASTFETLIALRPDDLSAYFTLADCYNNLGRSEDAIQLLDQVPMGGSDVAVGYYNVAVGLFNDGQQEMAIEALERALTENPEHARSHRLLGMVHLQAGRTPEALAAFRRYLELAPEDPEAETTRSLVAYLEQQEAGAKK